MDSRANRSSLDTMENDIFKVFSPGKRNFEVVSVTDIAPASIAGEIYGQSPKIIDNFVENIHASVYELNKLNIRSCSLNIAGENIFANPEKRQGTIKILKRISSILYEKKITLSLPVRVPATAGNSQDNYPVLVRETMSPFVKLAVNIHPHEIKNQTDPDELIGPYRFLMNSVSFIYEPEAGNFLVPKLMDPWFELLIQYRFAGPVIFLPRTANIAIFSREVERIVRILKEFQAKRIAP